MVVLFSKQPLQGLNVISIFKYKRHYRSRNLSWTMDKMINSQFSLHLGKFYAKQKEFGAVKRVLPSKVESLV